MVTAESIEQKIADEVCTQGSPPDGTHKGWLSTFLTVEELKFLQAEDVQERKCVVVWTRYTGVWCYCVLCVAVRRPQLRGAGW